MGPIFLALIIILISLIAYAVHRGRKLNKYWEERGIPQSKPLLFLGNSASFILQQRSFSELHHHIAKQFPNEPLVGFYDYTKPILLVKDPVLIEKVLIKDFGHFVDRGIPINKENPVEINLFTMTGKEWRALRYKLSPLFTTGKLRHMYGSMDKCGNSLSSLLDSDKPQEIEMGEILGRFAMDVIGSCAFGIDAGNLAEPENEFHKMGKKVFDFSFIQLLKFAFVTNFPNLAQILRINFNRKDVTDYFCNIIKDTIEYRKKNNIIRNDFLQQLMLLKEKGHIELQTKDPADDYLTMEPTSHVESVEITEDIMIGQAFSFLTAGFEATAAAIMFTLYNLANHVEIQDKVRKELTKHVENEEALSYDVVKKLTYLEQCVKETLRIFPAIPFIARICIKEYTFPNGFKIEPKQPIFIPVRTVHSDPKYFPNPEEYLPERFDADQKIDPCTYLPFGNGPRMCIAMRFALLQINYCLAKLLIKYEFRISPKSKPLELRSKSFIIGTKHPIIFSVSKLPT